MTAAVPLHLVKLCVGADSIEDLAQWQQTVSARRRAAGLDPRPVHVTRMHPRRGAEILSGGSLYWVIRGTILVRQRVLGLEEVTGEDGTRRCAIVLDPGLVRTHPAVRKPFQGWRYLPAADAPADLESLKPGEDSLPPDLAEELHRMGVVAR